MSTMLETLETTKVIVVVSNASGDFCEGCCERQNILDTKRGLCAPCVKLGDEEDQIDLETGRVFISLGEMVR